MHGNHYAGAIALDALLQALQSGRLPLHTGRITALFANIAGFDCFDAANPDASRFVDQDFNRVWSAPHICSICTRCMSPVSRCSSQACLSAMCSLHKRLAVWGK
jgi:succinylglutamate desuccinylase